MASSGYTAPEPPEIRLRFLLIAGGGDRDHPHHAWIKRLDDAADRASLSGGIVAFEHRDQGAVLELAAESQTGQAALLLFESGLVIAALQ